MLWCGAVVGRGVGGGGVMTSMRMRLVFSFCFVDPLLINRFGGDFRIVVAWLSTRRPCKNLAFFSLSRQKLENDARITRTKNIEKRKHRHIVLLTKTSQNSGSS